MQGTMKVRSCNDILSKNILATTIYIKKFQFLQVKDEIGLFVQCAFILAMIIFAVGSSKYSFYKVKPVKV